jgi:hypothetical protein
MLEALRNAYRELSENQKRQICEAVSKMDASLSQSWIDRAHLSGWRPQSLANRPAGLSAKLDQALLKPPAGKWDMLPSVVMCFLFFKRSNWINEVCGALAGATEETITTRLETVLTHMAAERDKEEFWTLFTARARLAPDEWITLVQSSEGSQEDQVESGLERDSVATAIPQSVPSNAAVHGAALLNQLAELDRQLATARIAKPFDVARTRELIGEIEASGQALRERLT